MREIRQLPAKNESPNQTAAANNEAKSWLFSGGLLVGVAAGLLGIALLGYANSLAKETRIQEKIDFGQSTIQNLESGFLWEAWDNMTRDGLPDWSETQEVRSNKQSHHLSLIAYGLLGASAFGFIAVVGSFLTKK